MNRHLPLYQSHRKVRAAKVVAARISETNPNLIELTLAGSDTVRAIMACRIPPRVDPVGGYFIEYDDGYLAWMPARAFEDGYTLIPEQPQ